MSLESCDASWECCVSVQCERVKEEPGLEPAVSVKQEAWEPVKQEPSEAAAGLYAGHEVKGELVLGPTTLQPPDAPFTTPVYPKNEEHTHSPPAERGHSPAGAPRPGARRADRPRLRACSVRLERLSPAGDERAHSTILRASVETQTNDGIKRAALRAASERCCCDTCGKQFMRKWNLIRHIRRFSQRCDLVFIADKNQIISLRKPPNVRPIKKAHVCEICSKQFSKGFQLAIHKRIHTGEKPYKCEICLKQFTQSFDCVVHRRIHTGEKPYKCEICLKQFSKSSTFNNHKRIHTGEKPYKCEFCLKQFIRKCKLLEHKRVHTGEKPYKCELCFECFSYRGALRNHIYMHTGERARKLSKVTGS